jgi:hypothetical protein
MHSFNTSSFNDETVTMYDMVISFQLNNDSEIYIYIYMPMDIVEAAAFYMQHANSKKLIWTSDGITLIKFDEAVSAVTRVRQMHPTLHGVVRATTTGAVVFLVRSCKDTQPLFDGTALGYTWNKSSIDCAFYSTSCALTVSALDAIKSMNRMDWYGAPWTPPPEGVASGTGFMMISEYLHGHHIMSYWHPADLRFVHLFRKHQHCVEKVGVEVVLHLPLLYI